MVLKYDQRFHVACANMRRFYGTLPPLKSLRTGKIMKALDIFAPHPDPMCVYFEILYDGLLNFVCSKDL